MSARRLRPLLLALAVMLGGADACDKPGWVTEFEQTMDREIPRVEQSLDRLGDRIDRLPDDIDARLAAHIRGLEAALRDIADGLAIIGAEGRQTLDAALLARVRQLEGSVLTLTTEVDRVAADRSAQVTLAVDDLLVDVERGARQVLDTWALQLGQVRWQGEQALASAGRVKLEWLGRLVGAGVILLGLVGFSVAFITRRRDGPWIPQVVVALLFVGLGAVIALSGATRRALLGGEVVMGHRPCPRALATAAQLLSETSDPPTEQQLTAAVQGVGALLACQAMAADADVFAKARVRAAELRRMLGLDSGCVDDLECHPGEHCAPDTGVCDAGCQSDTNCPAGQVCHPADRRCAPPCRTGECGADARCAPDGHCRRTTPPTRRPPRRPVGWAEVAVCRDIRCLRGAESPLARQLLERLGGR